MFANVAQHQYTHHFPHSPRYNDESDFRKSLSKPAGDGFTQHNRRFGPQNGDSGQASQRTQQYGQPLYKSRFNLRQRDQSKAPDLKGDVSEHMLRRKTPTGTLAAGYDGRPVEWAGRPHAIKRFLMPASSAVEQTAYHTLPTVEPTNYPRQMRPQEFYLTTQEQGNSLYGTNAEHMGAKDMIPSGDLRSNLFQPAGLDSVLNQGSWSYPYGNLAWEHRNPTMLQPMWPPSLGFTALNEPDQYRRRWAGDGYLSQPPNSFQAPYYSPQPIKSHSLGSNYQQFTLGNISQHEFNPKEKFDGNIENEFGRDCLDLDNNQSEAYSFQHGHSIPQQQRFSLAHRAQHHFAKPLSDRYAGYRDHPYGSHTSHHFGTQRTLNPRSGIHADQAQFNEKVLTWAHSIYGSLVASTQQSRRNIRNSNQRGDRRLASSIYLKPPRMPFINPTNDQGSIAHDYEINQCRISYILDIQDRTIYHEPQRQLYPGIYNKSSCDFATPTQGSGGNQPRQSPDLRHQHQVDGQDSSIQTTSSIVSQTLPAFMSASLSLQHEASLINAATAALDILDRLCQESNWNWTEGMLLSGCLAYGLGDYDKAMNWYLRILSHDPK